MDASGLFTVLGIFVAIIALISEANRHDFFLRASNTFWIFFITLILISLGVIYSNVISSFLKFKPFEYLWGFDEKTVILTCVILMILIFSYKLFDNKLPSKQYVKWKDRSCQLLREKKYHVLSYLLEKYLEQFLAVINKRTKYERCYDYIEKNSKLSVDEMMKFPPVKVGKYRGIKFIIFNKILSILPDEIGYKSVIYKSIEKLLKSSGFLAYLVEIHPTIPVKLTSSPSFLRMDEFTDNFFKNLIANKHSQLYRELKDNQHFMQSTGYRIETENFILDYYFSNPENAIKANIWKPIGDYVCDFIKKQKGKDNFYNSYCESFSYTEEPWECPIFVGIKFFDVMVKSAIYKKVDDHMWLMYYQYFLEEILKNIDRSQNSLDWQEFPLKFDYLIYNMVSNCSDWVVAANYLYNDDKNILAVEEASYCLGTLTRRILQSDKISDRQKIYYLEIILETMESLDKKQQTHLSQQIYHTLVRKYKFDAPDANLTWLKDIYSQVDHILRVNGSTFNKMINSL